jgi:hypothetical protein
MHRSELLGLMTSNSGEGGPIRGSNEPQHNEQHASFRQVTSLLYFSIFNTQLSCFDLSYEVFFRSIYIKTTSRYNVYGQFLSKLSRYQLLQKGCSKELAN